VFVHLPFTRQATVNGSFPGLRAGTADPLLFKFSAAQ
jgi:hypothetical protein